MKYTKIQEDRSKFNYMFGQLKECRLSLEKDDTPIVDIFNSIINVDLIKKSLTEKRTKFINKKRSENRCDFSKLFDLIRKDYKAFFNFSEAMSEYLYSEDKVLDVTIEPKEFVSLKNIKLMYEFKKDFIPSFQMDKELRDELLNLSAKLYLQTHKKKSDYYTYDCRPDKYLAQEFFSDLVSDISKLFFIKSLHKKELYFVFDKNELKIPTTEDDLSTRGDKLYICDFFEERDKEEDLFYFNKFLLGDNLSKDKLTEVFVDKIKGWLTYLTRYPKVAFFIYNNFSNIFKLDGNEVSFYTSGSNIDDSNKLIVEDIKISRKKRGLKRCKKIAEKCGTSISEFESFIETLIDFLEGFILKNPISGHYRIREGNSREILCKLIFEEIFDKFKLINTKLLLNVTNWKYLLYFDYETGELSPVNENIDKTIRISLVNKKNNSSSYNIFDKLCIEFSNAIWNNDSKKFDNLLVDLLKKSIEDKVRELLVSDYTLDDVTYKIVPLSLLTDNEIKSTLFDLSYKNKFNFSSIDEVIANTKDLSQIDRLFVLMREVVLEN